jgi:putative acetyltransferase
VTRLQVKTELLVQKPVAEVFDAVADPKKLCRHFTATSSGSMREGSPVRWTWDVHPEGFDVKIRQFKKNHLISFEWPATGGPTAIELRFEPESPSATLVKIVENGWESDAAGIAHLAGQTHGWTGFLCGLKAFCEFGINLRAGKSVARSASSAKPDVRLFRELGEHHTDVRALHERAFGRGSEGELVDKLRENGKIACSLVAMDGDRVVGHVAFTPVHVDGAPDLRAAGLGPVAVEEGYRGQGIATRLVELGLRAVRDAGFRAVFVLGEPPLYSKFGFLTASDLGIRCEYAVPERFFMAVELWPGALAGVSGTAKYAPEFSETVA